MRYRSLVLVFILCLSGVSGAAEHAPLRLATLEYPPPTSQRPSAARRGLLSMSSKRHLLGSASRS